QVVGVGVASRVLYLEVGAVLAHLLVRVLRIRLGGIGRSITELPEVGEWRRAALDVGLELDGERRLALVGVGVGPREQRGGHVLVLFAGLRASGGGRRSCGRRLGGRWGGGRGGWRLRVVRGGGGGGAGRSTR